jgi:hypothetical protein
MVDNLITVEDCHEVMDLVASIKCQCFPSIVIHERHTFDMGTRQVVDLPLR